MPNICLKRFMIYNSNEGLKESHEGDKLLYHWVKDVPYNRVTTVEQIDDICLCDASVNVSDRLSSSLQPNVSSKQGQEQQQQQQRDPNGEDPAWTATATQQGSSKRDSKTLTLTFDNSLVFISRVEAQESIWIAVHVGPSEAQVMSDMGDASSVSSAISGQQVSSQHGSDMAAVPTSAIEKVIENIYSQFCLLNGTFNMIYTSAAAEAAAALAASSVRDRLSGQEEHDKDKQGKQKTYKKHDDKLRSRIRDRIRCVCREYFDDVLAHLHLNSLISNVASLYNYIVYLQLNPLSLMKINSFINHLVCAIPLRIRHTIVIFNEQLLWSSLNMHDTRLLYNYLVSSVIRDALQEELSREVDKVRIIKQALPVYLSELSECKAATGSTVSDSEQASGGPEEVLNRCYLSLFRSSNNMTLGIVHDESHSEDLIERCEHILTSDSRLGVVPLVSLAQSVGQSFLRASQHAQHSQPQQQHSQLLQHQQQNQQQQQQQQQQPQPQLRPGNEQSATPSSTLSVAGQLAGSSSSSSSSWRRSSASRFGASSSGPACLEGGKYIYLNQLDASILWPSSVDMQNKEHLVLGPHSSANPQLAGDSVAQASSSKKLRLIRHLIELEPEMRQLNRLCAGQLVDELLARTCDDSWLAMTHNRFKTVYSVHSTRNHGLSEIQQSATALRSALGRK